MLESELQSRNNEIYNLREENKELKVKSEENLFSFNRISRNENLLNFYSGISTISLFLWVVNIMKEKLNYVNCKTKCLSTEEVVLMILMKLKLGIFNKDLAYRFGISENSVSKIYREYVVLLANCLKNLIVWPSRSALRANMPECFKKKYRDCVCIIDCTEIFIERPSDLTARAKTWSNYKHFNTIKYLIGITPAGAVMFISKGWGGRVSDKEITIKSGFFEKLTNGDRILADRGFLINKELAVKGAFLSIPSFTKGKKQLSAQEVGVSRQIANVRIHVERVIGRLKKFKILNSIIPISQVNLLNHVMTIICGVVNLNKSVVQ